MAGTLWDQAAGYLRAEGFEVAPRAQDLMVGSKAGIAGERDNTYVWVLEDIDPGQFGNMESSFRERFQEVAERDPSSQRFMLVPSLEGMSREFRQGARRWERVNIRVPVQFFDTAYKWEESHDAPSALRELRETGNSLRYRRAQQPYEDLGRGGSGDDLYPALLDALRRPSSSRRSVHVLVGPAGIGKSYLFSTLFAELYDGFMRDKQAQLSAPRPIPLFPKSLRFDDQSSVEAILRAFLRSEFARPLDESVLRWRLTHGWATWLIDGLDEVIARDAGFYDLLSRLIQDETATTPPSVLVCVRDSLFETSRELRDFIDSYSDDVNVYRLLPWGDSSKREYSRMRLGGGSDTFLQELRRIPHLNDLASIPFFCALIIEEYLLGDAAAISDEISLLQRGLDRMIEREYGKDMLPRGVVSELDVKEFLAAVAAEDLHGGFQGVPVSTVRELAEVTVTSDLPDAELDQLISNMTQLALFTSDVASWVGGSTGRLNFEREVMEHFLIAIWIADALSRPDVALASVLGGAQLPRDSVALRAVGAWAQRDGSTPRLGSLLSATVVTPIAYKNALQLAIAANFFGTAAALDLERRDVSGLQFADLDLSRSTFRGADLTDVVFRNCTLRDCNFEGALLVRTRFEVTSDAMIGANFGDLSRFMSFSVGAGGRVVDSPAAALDTLARLTSVRFSGSEPCPASQQLRHVLQKFVYPDGSARRSWLERRALLRGKRHVDPEPIVNALIQNGYLVPGNTHDHFERTDDARYSEIVKYVTGEHLSVGLRALLDSVCARPRCGHIGASRPASRR